MLPVLQSKKSKCSNVNLLNIPDTLELLPQLKNITVYICTTTRHPVLRALYDGKKKKKKRKWSFIYQVHKADLEIIETMSLARSRFRTVIALSHLR